jgi:ankyrin repeat protein
MIAASFGRDAALAALLAKDPDVDARDEWGRTALIAAAGEGKRSAVEALLRAKAKPGLVDDGGRNALWAAARAGDVEIVRSLMPLTPEAPPDATSGAALRTAVELGRTEVVRFLLSQQVDVNGAERVTRDTALHLAVKESRREIVMMLIAAGADPKARNRDGLTPLELARGRADKQVVDALARAATGA